MRPSLGGRKGSAPANISEKGDFRSRLKVSGAGVQEGSKRTKLVERALLDPAEVRVSSVLHTQAPNSVFLHLLGGTAGTARDLVQTLLGAQPSFGLELLVAEQAVLTLVSSSNAPAVALELSQDSGSLPRWIFPLSSSGTS